MNDSSEILIAIVRYAPTVVAVALMIWLYRRINVPWQSEFSRVIAMRIPVILADLDTGEIIHAAEPVEQMFGYFTGELVGKNVDELTPTKVTHLHAKLRTGYRENPTARPMFGVAGKRKDGKEIPIVVSLIPAVIDKRACVVVVVLDQSMKMKE